MPLTSVERSSVVERGARCDEHAVLCFTRTTHLGPRGICSEGHRAGTFDYCGHLRSGCRARGRKPVGIVEQDL